MTNCNHNHDHTHADKYTNMATFIRLIAGYVSDVAWLAGTLNSILEMFKEANDEESQEKAFHAGVLAIAMTIGALSAIGATYCHRKLDIIYQKTSTQTPIHTEDETTPLLPKSTNKSKLSLRQKFGMISFWQKVAIIGDGGSHIGEVAGPLVMASDLFLSKYLPSWAKLTVNLGITATSAIFTLPAELRTCINTLLEYNQMSKETYHKIAPA